MADDDRWIELDEHATAHYRQWYEASLIVADATEVMAKARAAIQDFLETHTSNVGSVNGLPAIPHHGQATRQRSADAGRWA